MAIHIAHVDSRITLMFDRRSNRISEEQVEVLREKFSGVEGVQSIELQFGWWGHRQMTVDFQSKTDPNTILRRMASALRAMQHHSSANGHADLLLTTHRETSLLDSLALPVAPISSAARHSQNGVSTTSTTDALDANPAGKPNHWIAVRRHLREFGYGVLAVGSFVMSWVGLVVPGIPTVPFVILTAHFSLQASPKLRSRLLKSRMFGSIMRDWQEHHAIHRIVQIEAYAFTVIIILIGFAVSPPNPVLYAIMAFMGAMGLIMISRIPVIEVAENGLSGSLPNHVPDMSLVRA